MFLLQKKKVENQKSKKWRTKLIRRKERKKKGREGRRRVGYNCFKSNIWFISEFPSVDLLTIFPWGFLMVSWFFVCWVFWDCILDILNSMLWEMNTESCNNPLENLDGWWQRSWNFLKLITWVILLKLGSSTLLKLKLEVYFNFHG